MKNVYTHLFLVITLLFVPLSYAQVDPIIYQFANNRLILNPASAGVDSTLEVNVVRNFMYPSLNESVTGKNIGPRTTAIAIGAPIYVSLDGSRRAFGGISLGYIHEKAGFETQNNFRIGLNKNIKIAQTGSLRLGAEWQYEKKFIAFSLLTANDSTDPYLVTSDQTASSKGVNAGAYFSMPKWNALYAGFSMTHITEERFSYNNQSGGLTSIRSPRQYYFISGLQFSNIFKIRSLHFEPALLLRSIGHSNRLVKTTASLQTTFSYKQILWVGGIFHYYSQAKNPRPGFIVATKLKALGSGKMLRIGYSCQPYITNSLFDKKKYFHEISLNYSAKPN